MSVRRIGAEEIFVLEAGRPLQAVFEVDHRYAAVAYRRAGGWHLVPYPEILALRRELSSGVDAEALLGNRGRVETVPPGTRTRQPALILSAAGAVAGAWLLDTSERPTRTASARPLRGARGGGSSPRRSIDSADEILYEKENSFLDDLERAAPVEGEADVASESEDVETIRRTPHLDAPDEVEKAPGAEFFVSVFVDDKELRAGESGEGLDLELPPDIDSIEVGVLLQLTGHFELAEGSEFAVITIARDGNESAKLGFKVRVVAKPPDGKAAISALFTLRGHSCGQIARVWNWATKARKAPPVIQDVEAPVSMPLHVVGEQPSLSIFITAPLNDGTHYQCAVQAPALPGYEEPTESVEFAVPGQAPAFMRTLLAALTDEKKSSPDRFRSLVAVGQEAWEAAPGNVREVLWKMIEEKVPPTTINIASVEPLLPWELMIPRRNVDGALEKIGPLGVEFAIGRWTRGDGQGPPPSLKVERSLVVAPTYTGHRELKFQDELQLIEENLNGRRVAPATIDDLDREFGKDHAGLLHFVCHGAAEIENDDAIEVDGGEVLQSRQIGALHGFELLCQTAHPLIFLNACSTGQMVRSLAGGGGFARSFGTLGANAIVAPLWPVNDELARRVAVELYTEALKPEAKPLAAILRDIRSRGYEEEDADTFAAYCFFGDPTARLEFVGAV